MDFIPLKGAATREPDGAADSPATSNPPEANFPQTIIDGHFSRSFRKLNYLVSRGFGRVFSAINETGRRVGRKERGRKMRKGTQINSASLRNRFAISSLANHPPPPLPKSPNA